MDFRKENGELDVEKAHTLLMDVNDGYLSNLDGVNYRGESKIHNG